LVNQFDEKQLFNNNLQVITLKLYDFKTEKFTCLKIIVDFIQITKKVNHFVD